jgi:cell wall-associated NlpC family hydrolase
VAVSGAAALAVIALLLGGCGREGSKDEAKKPTDVVLDGSGLPKGPAQSSSGRRSHARAVQIEGAGSRPSAGASGGGDGISPGAPSDAQVRTELKQARTQLASFKRHLGTSNLKEGARARVLKDGTAVAPRDAPEVVKRVILAGNEIAKFPYKWGGGHGAWRDTGYDCSGSVSFALAAAGLVKRPLTSGAFMRWGDEGQGDWITVFANEGHVFMFVAGLRFDTSGQGRAGTRWQNGSRTVNGFAERYYPGL